jgi:hypothetical protein
MPGGIPAFPDRKHGIFGRAGSWGAELRHPQLDAEGNLPVDPQQPVFHWDG